MTYPPQQPGNWQDPTRAPADQQPQQPYAVPTGQPAYPGSDQPTYPAYGQPAYPGAGQAAYGAYGYGAPAPAQPSTNGMAIASMVVSIVGALGLCAYGLGGYVGIVGAILGHVARRQVRERGEAGAGMALAGIIVGWIATAIAVVATIALIALVVFAVNNPDEFSNV
jgi:hypothetical protein